MNPFLVGAPFDVRRLVLLLKRPKVVTLELEGREINKNYCLFLAKAKFSSYMELSSSISNVHMRCRFCFRGSEIVDERHESNANSVNFF